MNKLLVVQMVVSLTDKYIWHELETQCRQTFSKPHLRFEYLYLTGAGLSLKYATEAVWQNF